MVQACKFSASSLKIACRPIRLAAALALSISAPGQLLAEDSIAAELFDKAGIEAHLTLVPDSIIQEAWHRLEQCDAGNANQLSPATRSELVTLVQDHFGADKSKARAIDAFNSDMNVKQLFATKKFFDSELGEKIVAAEQASKDMTEEEFVAFADEYLESSYWTDEREQLVRVVYATTRAARFVSILNGEMTVAVEVASLCEPSTENYNELGKVLKTARADARLIENFMAHDLNLIIATTFRDLTDKDLVEYVEFAKSNIGKAYFNAVLEASRKAIGGGLRGLRSERMAAYQKSISTAESND